MKKIWKVIKDYVYIIIIVVLFRTFIATPAIVEGSSMDTTLADGQIVLINKIIYSVTNISRYDIVVLNNKEDKDKIIKRVIGLPNEKISYKNNVLYINGNETTNNIKFEATEDFEVTTADNEYFVLGDNRDVSKDS
ncbi:MAG: signal peptidase I, partial [Tenericutes bacterium]|nr:signal peptidase I [Mycoplasmatota bacterium]